MVVENKATITYVQLLKEDLVVFRVVPNDGIIPNYKAGQFITLGIPVISENYKTVRRAYSLASHPENRKYYEFVVRWVRKPLPGRVTTQIFYASEGDKVTLGLPTGNALTINERLHDGRKDDRRIVCVGGGTGIAPFVSFAKHLHAVGDKREIVVLHGASYVDELSYRDTFTKLEEESLDRGKDQWNFRYRAAVSRPQEWFNRAWKGQTGRVENFLRARDGGKSPLEELVGEKITTENTSFYICGWQGTIDGVMDFLSPQGFVTYHDKREDGSFEVKYESYG
ncbi:MAG: ferredoxin--NADP reductase [Candidatus Nitrosotenuis sp.]|nr:MAG: ferredoxin--NADP reductase [Candidatus Nitrosotenuis sp.]